MTDTTVWVLFLSFGILSAFFLLMAIFLFSWWSTEKSRGISPYTGVPLRRTTELSYYYAEKVVRYMLELRQYDNRPFNLRRAAFCRDTGRIFPDCVTWYDVVKIDWTFLNKRYPGHYVSWGSLNNEQKKAIRESHTSLEGFQTDYSSPEPSPRNISTEYAEAKPGPLYVDIQTKVLLGWKEVPDTNLEVLVVQKPYR